MVLSQGTSRDTPCDPRGVAGLWPNGAPEAQRQKSSRSIGGTAVKHVDSKPRSSQRECGFL